ncbi:MAG: D-alanine--D-alanine ligase family protein [Myxococcota bacterium]
MAKLNVGLLFGGRSVEHEVSVTSATSIFDALDPARYRVSLIAVDPEGRWHLGAPDRPPASALDGPEVLLAATPNGGSLLPVGSDPLPENSGLDVILPIVHGHGGEDGTLQGLLELAQIPYVGSGVLSSAIQMDKDVSKQLLAAAGLPVVPWRVLRGAELAARPLKPSHEVLDGIDLPVFVKPANSGSSVGTSKVTRAEDLPGAIEDAARYDSKVMIEEAIDAREIEVAVLGDEDATASLPGEILTGNTFYDYQAKYVENSTQLAIPATLSEKQTRRLQEMAIAAFRVLEGEGMARVDFLLDRHSDAIYINELNSLPGFTEVSMFPRLWASSGLAYPALLDRLIELAIERHARRARLETRFRGGSGIGVS